MRKACLFLLVLGCQFSFAQSIFRSDTFTYTVNLDLSQNLYLKSVPTDLLKGYCRGDWNAYYPKKEMNQCLFDDFLARFNFTQQDASQNACLPDYCNGPYFKSVFGDFTRKMKFREVVYYDANHSAVKRDVLWSQLYFSRQEYDGWKHYNGPVFWLREVRESGNPVMVSNKNLKSSSWTLDHEFLNPLFIINENKQAEDKRKIDKYDKAEEN